MKLIKLPFIQTIVLCFVLFFSAINVADEQPTQAINTCFGCTDVLGNTCCQDPGPFRCATILFCRNEFGLCQFGSSFPAYNCNGTYQCTACPNPTTGGGTDGGIVCGGWGEWTACSNGTQTRCLEGAGCACESRSCSVCSSTPPNAPNLTSPSNNTLLSTNIAVLNWNNSGGWGIGCPQENSYRIRYKTIPNGTTNCGGGGWQVLDVGNPPGGANKSHTLNGLEWNSTYCWQIRRSNGSVGITSNQTWIFQTPAAPVITSAGFIHNDVCGAGISGRTDSLAAVTNPIQFEFTYTKDTSLNFEDAYFAFLPQAGPYAENANFQTFNIINGKVSNAGTFAVRLSSIATAPRISTLNKTSAAGAFTWSGAVTSGELANSMLGTNTADILNINIPSGTSATVNGNQASVRFQVRLENALPSGNYNVYVVGGTNALSTGTQPGTSGIYYTRVGTWRVDMTNPSVSVSSPESLGSNQYRINFSATDGGNSPSGIREARSYASASITSAVLFNSTYGYSLTNLPPTLPTYPAPGNAGINQSNLGNSVFIDQTPSLYADYSLNAIAIDNACNVAVAPPTNVAQSAPWILIARGTASAIGGISSLNIPNISFSGQLAQYSPRSVVSTELILLGNNASLSNNLVLKRKFDTQYNNKAVLPGNSSFSNWYDYLFSLASKNNLASIYTTTRSTLGTKISDFDVVGGTPPCTATSPGGVNLLSPADSATITASGSATLQWENANEDWGNGCPSLPFYRVLYKRLGTGTDCSIGTWLSVDVSQQATSATKTTTLTGLLSNSNYCWQVQRRNGSNLFTSSSIRRFRTGSGPLTNGGGTTISPTTDGSQLMQDIETEVERGSVAGIANVRQYYLVNSPEFRILSGTVCDQRAIIFVNGNLTIEPDFTNSSVENGCIFVVNGNVTIDIGILKTTAGLNSSIEASYDEIQAFIIANGTFTVLPDESLNTLKWDGLRIIGGVFANQMILQRNLNTTANDTQPAYLVVYDPRYRIFFSDDLSAETYSLREE